MLSKNDNTYNDECDVCNEFFSREYENDLARYVLPFIITSQTKNGSNKYPTYKPGSNSKFSIQFENNNLQFSNYNPDTGILTIKEDEQRMIFEIPRVPYYPYKVYKALVKIGISLLPKEQLKNYQHTIEWLMNPEQDKRRNLENWHTCLF